MVENDKDGDGYNDKDPSAPGFDDGSGPGKDPNDPSNSDASDKQIKLGAGGKGLGPGFGWLGDHQRRLFTPAELAAQVARRDLLRLLAAQGTSATILRSSPGPVSGASIFGGGLGPQAAPGAPVANINRFGGGGAARNPMFMPGALDRDFAGGSAGGESLRDFGRAFSRRAAGG